MVRRLLVVLVAVFAAAATLDAATVWADLDPTGAPGVGGIVEEIVDPILGVVSPEPDSVAPAGASSSGYGSYDVVQCGLGYDLAPDAESYVPGAHINASSACSSAGTLQVIGDGGGVKLANGASGNWHYTAPPGTGFGAVSVFATLHDRNSQNSKVEVENSGGANNVEIGSGNASDKSQTFTWSRGTGVRRTTFRGALRCVGVSGCDNPASNRAFVQLSDIRLTVEDYTAPTINAGGTLLSGGAKAGTQTLTFTGDDQGGGVRNSSVIVNGTTVSPKTYPCSLVNSTTGQLLSPCPGSASEAYSYNTAQAPFNEGQNTVSACLEDFDRGADGNPACDNRTVTIDNTAPNTTIDSGPSGTSGNPSPSFTFSASEPGSTFQCRLDGGSWSACSSPKAYSGLGNGPHTFDVRATDPAGNVDATPGSRTWTVDTNFPDTTIDSGPSGQSNNASPAFTFSSTKPGSTFECRLDGGAWSSCSSPKAYSSLSDASHTFEVRATDTGGNTDQSPASRTWSIDTRAPQTQIVSGPSGTVASDSPAFTFSADETGSSFECRLDGAVWSSCSSPKNYSGLGDGGHAFDVRATDASGNIDPTPATQSWRIDRESPAISVSGDLKEREDLAPIYDEERPSSTVVAGDSGSGVKSIEVLVDNQRVDFRQQDCPGGGCGLTDAYTFDPTAYAEGQHTITVRAVDQISRQTVDEWVIDIERIDPVEEDADDTQDAVEDTRATTDEPPDESASSTSASADISPADALPCTGPSEVTNFTFYSLGSAFESLPLEALLRRCDQPDPVYFPMEGGRANYVAYIYGTCIPESPSEDNSDPGGCAPPLEIQTWPACERSLSDYELEPGEPYPHEALEIRGVPAASFDDGTRIELYAGESTVVIFGDDPDQVLRAANAVEPEPIDRPLGVSAPTPASELQTPPETALDGTLPCST